MLNNFIVSITAVLSTLRDDWFSEFGMSLPYSPGWQRQHGSTQPDWEN